MEREKLMLKRKFVLIAAFALLFAGVSSGVYAQVTISGGLALSSVSEIELSGGGQSTSIDFDAKIGFDGPVYVDYPLPISIPLSLGFEIGVANAKVETDDGEDSITAIPLLIRAAYHFDLFPKFCVHIARNMLMMGIKIARPQTPRRDSHAHIVKGRGA